MSLGPLTVEKTYPVCRTFLDSNVWGEVASEYQSFGDGTTFSDVLSRRLGKFGLPPFLPELARIEETIADIRSYNYHFPDSVDEPMPNPSIRLVMSSWGGLASLIGDDATTDMPPEKREETVLVWRHPENGAVLCRAATDEDLLVLKLVSESVDPRDVAAMGGIPVRAVLDAVDRVAESGLLLRPPSLIRRDREDVVYAGVDDQFVVAPFFTIQWHITQACDLHCRHCYDRSRRRQVTYDQGINILDDLVAFCRDRHVRGQVSFSGGNPYLHPDFYALYEAAAERGFVTAVLGNPVKKEWMRRTVDIQKPAFYQVSLEGLLDYNDYIRGKGTFASVMAFLPVLREFDIPSHVMLTLSRENMDDVVPLAEILRNRADSFTFNRLAQVGEGTRIPVPTAMEYRHFLTEYCEMAQTNPVMGIKDNLINILRHETGETLFGGCAGFGCSAAFNFLAVLPDGEVHACRKFPSFIGNIYEQSVGEIYDSDAASRYRRGTSACRECPIRHVCGGCLAVLYGQGCNIFSDRDPQCFLKE